MFDSIIRMTDSYKVGHWKQYRPGTEYIYSYLEPRVGGEYREVMFFGLQYYLCRYFSGEVVTMEKIKKAAAFMKAHFGDDTLFNHKGWEHIVRDHEGHLPVLIKAVPEGTVVPEGNVLLTIENTCPQCFWITNYLETLLVELWYPCTIGTISREMKKVIRDALVRSGDSREENLEFRLHDFGYRGVSSPESAALGGAAHLLNFKGTDNLAGCELLMEYYDSGMPGFSIPAAEHSTITSWGEEQEKEAYKHILEQYPDGLVAVVSDSWDVFRAAREIWGEELRSQVCRRNGRVIVRPDSGNPHTVLPRVLDILGEQFGSRINEKSYKVLHDKIRVIQGDGIKRSTLAGILDAVMDHGWSADCISFGSGGGLLQSCDRDTQNFALKCSHTVVHGQGQDVFKRPATDPMKNSKRGRLKLIKTEYGTYATIPVSMSGTDELVPAFRDGHVFTHNTLEDMRARAQLD